VDAVKMDWCYHPALPPKQVYGMMAEALNKVCCVSSTHVLVVNTRRPEDPFSSMLVSGEKTNLGKL
jgi:hypothetical protein